MDSVTTVRAAGEADLEPCLDIIRRLPDYFTPDVPEKLAADWRRCSKNWVPVDDDAVVGFAIVEVRSPLAAEILWAAVDPAHRNGGVGTQLVESVIGTLTDDGARVVEVKTLDESANYEPYESTTAFWRARGFIHIDTVDPYPPWPGSPCAIYVRPIG
jgi:N-acetylglutamate synthase-like GNAT family acetyltransferase